MELFDKQCLEVIDDNINMIVPWYLMASYAYYVDDDPILSDFIYDRLAKQMLDMWDMVDHVHKDLITKEMLEGGTFLGEYPSRIRFAVQALKGDRRVTSDKKRID